MHVRNYFTGLPRFHFDEAAAGAGGAGGAGEGAGAAGAGAAAAWHTGLDAEIIGHIKNRGLTLDNPKAIVDNLAKAHREASSKLGVPADQLIRVIRPDSPEADVKAFWGRLGAPQDPKEYDFAGIKYADGSDLEPTFADAIRASAARLHMPKDMALELAKDLAKFADGDEQQQIATRTAKLNEEKAALAAEWKADPDGNLYIAKQGAKALGLTPEQVNALENLVGYAGIMKAMHKVGTLNKEPNGLIGPSGNSTGAMTREQATARKADLMADTAWTARYLNGDVAARTEMLNLNRIITGDFSSAA